MKLESIRAALSGQDVELSARLREVELVAVDLDGTLLNGRSEVDDETVAAVSRLVAANVSVVPATGRILSVLPEALFSIEGIHHVVCGSGSAVLELGGSIAATRVVHERGFAPGEAAELVDMLKTRYRGDVLIDVSCDGVLYSERPMLDELDSFEERGFSVVAVRRWRTPVDDLVSVAACAPSAIGRIGVIARNESVRQHVLMWLSQTVSYELGNSCQHNIEINPRGTSKWRGVTWLCEHLGLRADRIMAVGDSPNDVELIRRSWLGVAMANGDNDVRTAADAVTVNTNEAHGVARLLDELAGIKGHSGL